MASVLARRCFSLIGKRTVIQPVIRPRQMPVRNLSNETPTDQICKKLDRIEDVLFWINIGVAANAGIALVS
ncbi:MAG: hypothetical protein Harvfovirus12_5 [Harvfovirus sp.]|uniref:Uncharacterized protein n=1 Tax=Harvfovirus sp. TaxID=2487768 RepID=A0A3G5A660_9VIRU|nr:MAG: hypothetical protein Harvfovirus12_5 [Harvfovirus sp.]